jgi:two-component system, OmpR family, sensor kinase
MAMRSRSSERPAGTLTSGTLTSGTLTSGTLTSGTLTSGTLTSGTLIGRVAVVAALSAVGGGLLAAASAVALAEALVLKADDRRLRDEALEILADVEKHSAAGTLAPLIEEERKDLAMAGLRLAVHRDGVLVGGDGSLPLLREGCATERGAVDKRICVATSGPWTTVIAANEVPSLGVWAMGGIGLVAVVVAALIGTLTSRRLARWAVGPLARLEARLGAAPMDEAINLGADEGVREIDALRTTLRALLDRRAEALRTARLFAAGAAHELRTPLTTLSGELELLTEEPLPTPVHARLEGLRGTTARIASLVERLLMLARVGAAEAMRHDAVEIGDLVEELKQRLPAEVAARLSYVKRAPSVVRGDESLLAVLCENVVSNALLHGGNGTPVRVTLDEREGTIVLDVIDEGPGVPTSERARFFAPFQRGIGAGPGAGLGLSLVSQIARAHGGEASFVDTERGAHLCVRLPRWTPTDAPRAPAGEVLQTSETFFGS